MRTKELLAVAAGGAVGAAARHGVYLAAAQVLGAGFPFGTLIVNIVGSFAMGVLVEGMALVWAIGARLRLFLAVGVLGGFTTFSAFSLEAALMIERNQWGRAAGYALASVVLCVAAVFAGLALMRSVL